MDLILGRILFSKCSNTEITLSAESIFTLSGIIVPSGYSLFNPTALDNIVNDLIKYSKTIYV